MSFKVPEKYRFDVPGFESTALDGNNGLFRIRMAGLIFKVIASDGMGWEHVSVSLPHRCPTWSEMCDIKALFWGPEDWVVQYHPAESEYVNNCGNCLHLWRPADQHMPIPPGILVGFK